MLNLLNISSLPVNKKLHTQSYEQIDLIIIKVYWHKY